MKQLLPDHFYKIKQHLIGFGINKIEKIRLWESNNVFYIPRFWIWILLKDGIGKYLWWKPNDPNFFMLNTWAPSNGIEYLNSQLHVLNTWAEYDCSELLEEEKDNMPLENNTKHFFRRFEYTSEGHSKYWEIWQAYPLIWTHWGKIGLPGKQTSHNCYSSVELKSKYNKLIESKLAKGYIEVIVEQTGSSNPIFSMPQFTTEEKNLEVEIEEKTPSSSSLGLADELDLIDL